jgi:hypothetical protein
MSYQLSIFIFPRSSVKLTLYPVACRSWKRGWNWTPLNIGLNGILLTIMVDGKEITEKTSFEIIYEKKSFYK